MTVLIKKGGPKKGRPTVKRVGERPTGMPNSETGEREAESLVQQ